MKALKLYVKVKSENESDLIKLLKDQLPTFMKDTPKAAWPQRLDITWMRLKGEKNQIALFYWPKVNNEIKFSWKKLFGAADESTEPWKKNAGIDFYTFCEKNNIDVDEILKKQGSDTEEEEKEDGIINVNNQVDSGRKECNNCKTMIEDDIYKCTVCEDFDFCEDCVLYVKHDHHFIRVLPEEYKLVELAEDFKRFKLSVIDELKSMRSIIENLNKK